jgi:hypothetical protein
VNWNGFRPDTRPHFIAPTSFPCPFSSSSPELHARDDNPMLSPQYSVPCDHLTQQHRLFSCTRLAIPPKSTIAPPAKPAHTISRLILSSSSAQHLRPKADETYLNKHTIRPPSNLNDMRSRSGPGAAWKDVTCYKQS